MRAHTDRYIHAARVPRRPPQVRDVKGTTGRASALLRRMNRREVKFKCMIGFLVLALIGGIVGIAYALTK